MEDIKIIRERIRQRFQLTLPEQDRIYTQVPCLAKYGKFTCTKEVHRHGDHIAHSSMSIGFKWHQCESDVN